MSTSTSAIAVIENAVTALDAAISAIRASAPHAATTHDLDMLRFAQTMLREIVARIEDAQEQKR